MKYYLWIVTFATLFCLSCNEQDPNVNNDGMDELKLLEIDRVLDKEEITFTDLIYIPIYSDIYVDIINQNTLLSATLSIRNTSSTDSLFVSRIEYFNTVGDLVREYIDNTISIPPMGTVNYVVEKDDDTGGPGANFIVELKATNPKVKPIIQAVMIGQSGNKGFAFSTNGFSIE